MMNTSESKGTGRWSRRVRALLAFAIVALPACSDSSELGLKDSAKDDAIDPDAEAKRLREMQLLRFQEDVTCADGRKLPSKTVEVNALTDTASLWGACDPPLFDPAEYGSFTAKFNAAVFFMCQGRLARELANSARPPIVTTNTEAVNECGNNFHQVTRTFPPQSAATNQLLLKRALGNFGSAFVAAADGITSTVMFDPTILNTANSSVFSGLLSEAADLRNKTFDELLTFTLDVADAQRSSTSSLKLATERAVTGTALSRSEAAHLLVGGENGLPGIEGETLCASAELTPQANIALEVFRQAAPSPLDVADPELATSELVNGTLARGSIKQRLIDIYDQEIVDTVEAKLKLRLTDFEEARKYLRDEIRVFARSATKTIPSLRQADGGTPTYQRHAGVANPPQRRHGAYWSAIARYKLPISSESSGFLASNLQNDVFQAEGVLREMQPRLNSSSIPAAVQDALLGAVGLLAANTRERFIGSVFSRQDATWPQYFELASNGLLLGPRGHISSGSVEFFGDRTGLRIIVGDDALSCAADAHVEGLPCTESELTATFTGELTSGMTLCSFDASGRCFPTSAAASTASRSHRLYVVRPKAGAVEPGQFDILAGVPKRDPADTQARQIHLVPEVERRVGDVLAPNRHWCTQSELTCAGAKFDERMPLENELASTEDGVESSWKHYLARAKEAAQASDELGRQFIESSTENDLRIETIEMRVERRRQEVEETLAGLQDICGTTIDPMVLLELLSGESGDDLALLRQKDGDDGISCTTNADCASGFTCLANVCLKRPSSVLAQAKDEATIESLYRLEECIGPETEESFVTLGDSPVCIWHPTGAPSQMCSSANEETHPCPTLKPASCGCYEACDENKLPAGGPFQVVTVDSTLGYFSSNQGNPSPPRTLCDNLRGLRDASWPTIPAPIPPELAGFVRAGARMAALNQIRSSDMFHPWNLLQFAERVGFAAYPGGRSAITLDGNAVITTATCSGTPGAPTCDSLINLGWCPNTCSTAQDWAVANDRMMKAVMALRLSTVNKLDKVYVPMFVRSYENRVAAVAFSTYPGTSFSPIKQSAVDAGADNCYWPAPAGFTVFEADSTGTLPPIWRDSVNGDVPLVDGEGFKFAIGNIMSGVPVGFTGCGKDVRTVSLWRGLSTATDFGTLNGAIPPFIAGPFTPAGADVAIGPMAEALLAPGRVDDTLVHQYALHQPLEPRSGGGGFDLEHLVFYGPSEAIRMFGDAVGAVAPDGVVAVIGVLGPANDAVAWGAEVLGDGLSATHQVGKELLDGDIGGALECLCSSATFGLVDCGCDDGSSAPPPPPPRYEAKPVRPFDNQLSSYLDAAELVCNTHLYYEEFHCDPENPPEIVSARDLWLAREYLQCSGDRIERQAGLLVLPNFPTRAQGRLIDEQSTGSYPAVGGDMGAAVSRLRGALVQVQRIGKDIAAQVRALGDDIDQVRTREELSGIRDQIAGVQFRSTVANYMAQCGTALASVPTLDLGAIGGRAMAAAISCANAIEQSQLAEELKGLQMAENALLVEEALNDLRGRLRSRADAVRGLKDELIEQIEEVNAQLAEIEKLRDSARRILARALYKASDQAKSEAEISTVYSNRAAVSEERYQRAHRNAVRLSFLAKRAIETRLGVRLSTMHEELPLVEAPATWEGTVCATTGIDYGALKNADAFDAGQFADQFIGDYVTKLENLVESYRLAHDFHEGRDTAIISLKDDIFNVKRPCEMPSGNQLRYSGQLDQRGLTADVGGGWRVEGCAVDSEGVPLADCVNVEPVAATEPPAFAPLNVELADASPYRIVLGRRTGEACAPPSCGYVPGAALMQSVLLAPGQYLLSWYYAPGSADSTSAGGDAMDVIDRAGTPVPSTMLPADSNTGVTGWVRHTRSFTLTGAQPVKVRIGGIGSGKQFFIAATMLERFSGTDAPVVSAYENTGAELLHNVRSCPDTDGTVFRAERWTPGCLRLCSTGFGADCGDDTATEHCYREATFNLNQRDVEFGKLLGSSGFASGNFNYRIEGLSVNFVGTGIVNCQNSETPQSCYGKGNLQYTLEHAGPFIVRNHFGEDFRAALFQGNIEHARGLALERYITNPIASTDRDLLSTFVRRELEGRPLDGNYRLRVWNHPDVKFEAITDVQLVLDYRYWTRFN